MDFKYTIIVRGLVIRMEKFIGFGRNLEFVIDCTAP
jgi:hypothetical protein